MATDIRKIRDANGLIAYFAEELEWNIDVDDFEDIEDIAYDFDARDIGLKEEAFAKIDSLRQLPPLVDGQKWGVFCVEFDSRKFEVTALRKILSGLIPKRRNSADHAVWNQQDLLFLCFWGEENNRTIGVAHFEEKESGLPQIKMISCAPAVEDFTQIQVFEERLSKLRWPNDTSDEEHWREQWSSAFVSAHRQTIRDASTLTIQLALEAQEIRNRILSILEVESANGYVHLLYEKFKNTLIHDMTEEDFADMYAQTVVYGLFSARCMDETQEDFSASEAVKCIPNTNPFLKNLLEECLGSQNSSKLSFDELEINNVVDLLKATRTDEIIKDFNRQTGGGKEDPVIHFYEEFLTAYDKTQRVQRGVYYTPQPVVNFIVRAVDTIIKDEFRLKDGLASTETKTIKIKRRSKRKIDGYHREVEDTEEVPAIQVLDPATGTGTFIRQTILQIYENFKSANKGLSATALKEAWNEYVPKHLLPRINAFELMMAPYAVTHMKLAMVLRDTGYEFKSEERLNVYLTNTLEEPGNSEVQMKLWDDPLATESIFANAIKKNSGINVVIGNPPYSYSSSNKGKWITKLTSEYKEGLNERKIHIDDDYVKFIRLGQHYIGDSIGILAYISNNSFIDGLTHRVMRKKLLEAFDEIYVVNLHGDSKKGETAEDGSKDENVFDIQQGVCISFFIKNGKKENDMAAIKHCDLYGSRDRKYSFLQSSGLQDCSWTELSPIEPSYFFVPKDFSKIDEYNEGFGLNEAFAIYSQGILSGNDNAVMCNSYEEAENLIHDLLCCDTLDAAENVLFRGRTMPKHWSLKDALKDIRTDYSIEKIQYRPFDSVYTAYTETSCGWLWRPRSEVMSNMKNGFHNIGLVTSRMIQKGAEYSHVFVSECITDKGMLSSKDNSYTMPLYIYRQELGDYVRSSNFNKSFIDAFTQKIGLTWNENGKRIAGKECNSEDIFSYIYAYLHSRKYREKFRQMLTSEFARVPYPSDMDFFWNMVKKGRALVDAHLLHSSAMDRIETRFVGDNREIEKISYKENRVLINKSSYFENVPNEAYTFLIGSYRPLEKWLKDRKGIMMNDDNIATYCNIVNSIITTINVMDEIDETIGD